MLTEHYEQTLTRRELRETQKERKMFGVKNSDAIESIGGEFSSSSFIGGVSMKSLSHESDCKQQL